MIQVVSQVCYLQIAHHALDSQEALVDYLSRMTWMILTSRALLLLTMLIHQIPWPGTSVLPPLLPTLM